jgi:hypothetical protein
MADRLSWWVIPGALVVLARVATLVGGDSANGRAGALDAPANLDPVVLQDATGHRSVARSWNTLTTNALVLALPAGHSGEQATVTLWRRRSGEVEATAWLTFPAKVRDDGTIPVGGLDAGQYDVRAVFAAGGETCSASDVAAPGQCSLSTAAAPAPGR